MVRFADLTRIRNSLILSPEQLGQHPILQSAQPSPTTNQTMISLMSITPATFSWVGALLLCAFIVYYFSTKTDIAKIKGIPEIPGGIPMY
jgi:hypothetical protein